MQNNSKNTIFVQLVSLKNSQTIQTIQDCIEQAQYPENLRFCIAYKPESKYQKHFQKYEKDLRFKFIDISDKKRKGVSWAKNLIQQYYKDEKYTLQLGNYHKFIKSWDTELITMLEDLKVRGYKKPLLTTYLPSFNPKNDPSERVGFPWQITFKEFCSDGTATLSHEVIEDWEILTSPVLGRFCSSHFYFTDGSFIKKVPNDPNYIDVSEEISLAVRAFTWGYDIFHPHTVLIWNSYEQKNIKPTLLQNKKKSLDRYYKLLQIQDLDINLDIYNLGPHRTLKQYEKYGNISFKDRISSKTCICFIEKNSFEYTIRIEKKDFLTDPKTHTFWAISFHDSNKIELYRQDSFNKEILASFNKDTEIYTINRKFQSHHQPAYCSIWPMFSDGKWGDRIIQPLTL